MGSNLRPVSLFLNTNRHETHGASGAEDKRMATVVPIDRKPRTRHGSRTAAVGLQNRVPRHRRVVAEGLRGRASPGAHRRCAWSKLLLSLKSIWVCEAKALDLKTHVVGREPGGRTTGHVAGLRAQREGRHYATVTGRATHGGPCWG